MNHYCEVNVGTMATSPDDPRYRPCDKLARFDKDGTWMCAEHFDEDERLNSPAAFLEAMEQL